MYVPRSAAPGLGMMCMAKLMITWEKELAGKPVSCECDVLAGTFSLGDSGDEEAEEEYRQQAPPGSHY